jgi:2,3-diketo-5-methylthio-1-phosphopentane phosphatase
VSIIDGFRTLIEDQGGPVSRPTLPDRPARRPSSGLSRTPGAPPTPGRPSGTSASRRQGRAAGEPAVSIAVLIDYDGTIATNDVSDELVRAASSAQDWLALELAYREGAIGSRALLEVETRLLPRDPTQLPDVLRNQPHDPAFAPFVAFARGRDMVLEVVSDGLGFFVGPAIAELGVGDIPVYSASLRFGPTGPQISFPHGNPSCSVCGTCKRTRVLHHQAAGRHVVYIGDGYSDQYAVQYADTVFAKDDLVSICRDRNVPFVSWTTFADVETWLSSHAGALPPPRQRPFVCGPEAVVAREDDADPGP